MAGLMAERWYSRLSRMFNHELKGRQPLVLYGSSPEFQQTTVIPEILGEGTGGVTESFKRRIVLPYGASLSETDHVIGHELVHAFQYDIMAQGHSDQSRGNDSSLRIPLWFIEGMAEYLSIGPVDPNTSMWMRDAVRRKELPEIKKLDNSYKYFPYRWGQAVWAYITGRWGDEVIGKMMKSVGRTGDYEIILESILGIKMKQLSADWHKSMQDAYAPLLDKTQLADKIAKPLFKGTQIQSLQHRPVHQPGREIPRLPVDPGPVLDRPLPGRRRNRQDPPQDHLDGRRPPFRKHPVHQVRRLVGRQGREVRLRRRGQGPAGPDHPRHEKGQDRAGDPLRRAGRDPQPGLVARRPLHHLLRPRRRRFGPLHLRPQDKILKQMTRDPYGDLQPVWSPDGKTIAFVTERFSTNLEWVDVGHYELALLDVESGRIQKLLAFPNGKNINPQWTADSSALYFLSDQSGKTDLYRIDVASAKISEITNLYAGIAGITELSPSISVALDTGRLVFSGYHDGYYTIYSIDDQTLLQGQSFLAQFERNPAILPPRKEPEGALLGLLKNPLFGLPKDTNFAVVPYKPKLGLDYVSPPNVAVGVDRYGTYGAGGVAAYWSDMLGYHTIVTTAFTGSRLIDTSGVLAYLNNRGRFNWGAAAQRIVYPYPYYLFYLDPNDGLYHEVEDVFRLINYDVSVFGSYPFSQVSRFQLSGGYRVQDFNHTVYERIYDLNGFLLDYRKFHPDDTPPALSLRLRDGRLLLRHRHLRRDEPDPGPEHRRLRLAGPGQGHVHDVRGGFPEVLHARQALHPGLPGPAHGALRQGRRGHPVLPALHRLLGPRPRLRVDHQRGAERIPERSVEGVRFQPALRQQDDRGQRRIALPAARAAGARQGLLWRLAPRVLRLLRLGHRLRLEPEPMVGRYTVDAEGTDPRSRSGQALVPQRRTAEAREELSASASGRTSSATSSSGSTTSIPSTGRCAAGTSS